MWFADWFRPPRHLLVLFLAITLVLTGLLGWFGWRLLQQDRALETQRIQERLDHAADLVAAELLRRFTETEGQLVSLLALPESELPAAASNQAKQLSDDALIVVVGAQRVEAYPSSRLLYYAFLPPVEEPPEGLFAAGEAYEFQQKDYPRAIAAFRELARSEDERVRAGALLRLGRGLRKTGQLGAALRVYEGLARLGSTAIEGLPAELLARHARCVLLDELGKTAELQSEAEALYAGLHNGRWRITRAAYRFYAEEAQRWLSSNGKPVSEMLGRQEDFLALTAALESLWEEWQRRKHDDGGFSGRRSLWLADRPGLELWRGTPERLVALMAGPRHLEQQVLGGLQPLLERQGVKLSLTDAEGHRVVSGFAGEAAQRAVRPPGETQLPWTLHLISADPSADLAQFAGRRRLLLGGLAMAATLVLIGSYFIVRAVTRELEVARLQSGFVAAVSHEFRSPLTSLRQLTELLASGRVASEERRDHYYRVLMREGRRLHRLVEGLLDFGRMEAGALEYQLERVDGTALVGEVVREFQREIAERGYQIEVSLKGPGTVVQADQEALTRALWNLLDNAVKYSPQCQTVWLEVDQQGDHLQIRVRDRGLGISESEQKEIFKKFVRGPSSEKISVKGTGIGLAMVHQIVSAHGGKVRVESEPGQGSTFTILLPVAE